MNKDGGKQMEKLDIMYNKHKFVTVSSIILKFVGIKIFTNWI